MYVAFLRAINVGGRNVGMAELRGLFTQMGFAGVESFIASGNIILEAAADHDAMELETRIEAQLQVALGYEVRTFVRTPAEVAAIAWRRPFGELEGSLQYGLVAAPLRDEANAALQALETDADRLACDGREIAWLRLVPAASKLTNGRIERALGVPATFRNATTIRRLAAKCGS